MDVKLLLEKVKSGEISLEDAENELKKLPYDDIGIALCDNHRKLRTGFAEVIFCQGKTPEQAAKIAESLLKDGGNLLATRAKKEHYEAIRAVFPNAVFNEAARTIYICNKVPKKIGSVCVCCAGTADIPVAEEAAVTAEAFGATVDRVFDVGVSGIHRLFSRLERIENSDVIIAVAGMEGALPSVLGGLVERPVIAVPTSIGYGANFGGLSALLSMLNSCSAGIGVMNIDNGFGAGFLAGQILRLVAAKTSNRD